MAGYGLRHPSVTVILRAHDAARTLNRALNCLAAQTLPNLQVLVVDEGSKDGTSRILTTAEERDVTLECAHIDSSDPADSFNLGLERARGEFVFLMDAADTLAPNALERLYELSCTYGLDMAMAAIGTELRPVPDQAGAPRVYTDDADFHADAWKYFDAGILPYPGGKLLRMARVKTSGARFEGDGGISFMAGFLRDAQGAAFDGRAVYNAGNEILGRSFGWDLSCAWTDEHEQDLLDELFAHWGLSDDSKTRQMLQRHYVTRVITTILAMCSPSCELTEDERRAHVERVITSDRTQKIASEAAPWSGAARAMLMPIRHKDVKLAMGEGRIFSWLSRHSSSVGAQLFG